MTETRSLGRRAKEELSEEVTFEKKKSELKNKQITHTTKFIEDQTVMTFNCLTFVYIFY